LDVSAGRSDFEAARSPRPCLQVQDRLRRPAAITTSGLHATAIEFSRRSVRTETSQLAVKQRLDQRSKLVGLSRTGGTTLPRGRQRDRPILKATSLHRRNIAAIRFLIMVTLLT
jgi:hypothetical protein